VAHCTKDLSLGRRKYCLELLSYVGLTSCKPVNTPNDYACRLGLDDCPPVSDVATYFRLVGLILCLITTRPSINFATEQPSQFMSNLLLIIILQPFACFVTLSVVYCSLLVVTSPGIVSSSVIASLVGVPKSNLCSSYEAEYRILASITRELQKQFSFR
jgi:hypothetical protein